MNEQEKLAARTEQLRREAEVSGITDPPEVDLIRWIKPEEFVPVHVKCLNEAGFNVTPTVDNAGVDSQEIPRSQTTALLAAQYVCIAQYTVDPRYSLPLTDAQLGVLYDYLVEFYVPCVEGQGYELAYPPTKEVYVASSPVERWQPISELMHLSQGQWTRLVMTCPDTPPSDLLYGS